MDIACCLKKKTSFLFSEYLVTARFDLFPRGTLGHPLDWWTLWLVGDYVEQPRLAHRIVGQSKEGGIVQVVAE